jgi:hypothetical protein
MFCHCPETQKYTGLHDDRLRTAELDFASPLLWSDVNHDPQIPAQMQYKWMNAGRKSPRDKP